MKTLMLGLALLTTMSTFAKEGGNGGGGHVCPSSVEVYDLYEGRERFGLNIANQETLTTEETLDFALKKVGKQYLRLSQHIETRLKEVKAKLKIRNIQIERTLDADNLFHDPGCDYQQIANWDSEIDQILVSKNLWDRMSDFQKGVLLFHEAAYKVYRYYNENTGVQSTRRFVSEVFSSDVIKTELIPYPHLNGGFESEKLFIKNSKASKSIGLRILPQDQNCHSQDVEVKLELAPRMDRPINVTINQAEEYIELLTTPELLREGNAMLGLALKLKPGFTTKLKEKNPSISSPTVLPFAVHPTLCGKVLCSDDYGMTGKPVVMTVRIPACNETHQIVLENKVHYGILRIEK